MCGKGSGNAKILGKRLNEHQGKNPKKLKGKYMTTLQNYGYDVYDFKPSEPKQNRNISK